MELVIARFGFRKRKRRAKAIDVAVKKTEELRKQYGLDALFFPGGSSGVGIDTRKKIILIFDGIKGESVLPFENIVSVEVLKDDALDAKSNREREGAGAAIGKPITRRMGALVEGLFGSRRTESQISWLKLRIVTQNLEDPVHDIVFLDPGSAKAAKNGDRFCRSCVKECENWHARLSEILRDEDSGMAIHAEANPAHP